MLYFTHLNRFGRSTCISITWTHVLLIELLRSNCFQFRWSRISPQHRYFLMENKIDFLLMSLMLLNVEHTHTLWLEMNLNNTSSLFPVLKRLSYILCIQYTYMFDKWNSCKAEIKLQLQKSPSIESNHKNLLVNIFLY